MTPTCTVQLTSTRSFMFSGMSLRSITTFCRNRGSPSASDNDVETETAALETKVLFLGDVVVVAAVASVASIQMHDETPVGYCLLPLPSLGRTVEVMIRETLPAALLPPCRIHRCQDIIIIFAYNIHCYSNLIQYNNIVDCGFDERGRHRYTEHDGCMVGRRRKHRTSVANCSSRVGVDDDDDVDHYFSITKGQS
jgi:hypothetical protein